MKKILLIFIVACCTQNSFAQCSLTATASGTNVTCYGYNNGIGAVTYTGATGSVSILWQPGSITSTLATGLAPGIHTVTVTDANNCTVSQTLIITQPSPLTINTLTNATAHCGQADGSATVVASGGVGGLTYQWSSNPNFTLSTINNIVAGTYTVVVTDANGCVVSGITSVNDIVGPVITATYFSSVTCYGQSNGTAGVTAMAPSGPVTYSWSYQGQTTPTVTNLPNGLHSVTVTDPYNCITSNTFIIVQPTQVVTAISSQTNVNCNGFSNGGATVLVNGGNPGYTYSWTPSAQNGSVLSNASSGTYTVLVKDVNNCASTSTVTITQPNPLYINTNTVINVSCYGGANGQIIAGASGGSSPFTIQWTPNVSSSYTATNLMSGTYTLLVTDANGCPGYSIYTITQPSALVVLNTATTPATCGNSNGTATVNISGGTSPYTYSWNTPGSPTTNAAGNLPAGPWTLTTTDNKGCTITTSIAIVAPASPSVSAISSSIQCFGMSNGSATLYPMGVGPFTYSWSPIGLTTPIVNGLGPAVYNATVTDSYGCSTSTTIVIASPNLIILNVSPTQTICFGGVAAVYGQAAGGTPPYSYTLTNINSGITSSSTTPGGIITNETLTTTTQYTVSLIDNNGCVAQPKTILVNVTPKLLASGSLVCVGSNSVIVLSPNIISPGNGGPYNYNWSNGFLTPTDSINTSTITGSTIFTLVISDGCTIPNAVAQYTVDLCTAISQLPASNSELMIYPNPTSGNISVQSFIGNAEVYNSTGQLLLIKVITETDNNISLLNKPAGCYFVRLSSNKIYKIIKE